MTASFLTVLRISVVWYFRVSSVSVRIWSFNIFCTSENWCFFCATVFRSDVTYYYPLLFYYGALFVKVYVFRIPYVVGLRIDCPSKFYQTEEYIYSTHS